MKGWFQLATVSDLLSKLERDMQKLQSDPLDPDNSFAFFVTAEQMLDWQYPGNKLKSKRERIRNSELLLQIVSHLASTAKHFHAEASRHQSISQTFRCTLWPDGFWPERLWPKHFWPDNLVIQLDKLAIREFGRTIGVVELAEKVLVYWKDQICISAKVDSN